MNLLTNKVENKKFLIILCLFLCSCFITIYADDNNPGNVIEASQYLLNILTSVINFFGQPLFRAICCLFLIGESIALIYAGGSNNIPVMKKLTPLVVGTVLFVLSANITTRMFDGKSQILGISKLPLFNHYIEEANGGNFDGYSLFNVPLINAFNDFSNILFNIRNTVLVTCMVFCFVNICFNAFKLWAGTIELKKVYVDMIYKFVLVLTLCAIYPTVQQKVIQLGMSLGMSSTNGSDKLNKQFTQGYLQISKNMIENIDTLEKYLILNSTLEDEDGNLFIDESVYNKIIKSYNLSSDEVNTFLKNNNMTKVSKKEAKNYSDKYWKDDDGKVAGDYIRENLDANYDEKEPLNSKFMQELINAPPKSLVKRIRSERNKILSLLSIMSGDDMETILNDPNNDNIFKLKKTIKENINGTWYNPFLTLANGNATYILGLSKIIKTISLYTEIISTTQSLQKQDDETGKAKSWFLGNTLESIKQFLMKIIFWIGSYACMLYISCSYIIMVIEYLIVTSLAPLLIPFFFIDSVKSYAQNIIGLFVKFLFKFMIVGVVTFWSLTMLMDTLENSFLSTDLDGIYLFIYVLENYILISLVVMTSEKIANTLVSGNPSLGTGDLHHLAHDAGAIGRTAGKTAKTAGKLALKTGQFGIRTVGNTGARFLGGNDAHKQAVEDRTKELMQEKVNYIKSDGTNGTRNKTYQEASKEAKKELGGIFGGIGSGLKSVVQGASQDVGDVLYKGTTGIDKQHRNEDGRSNGALSGGKGYVDSEGRQFTAGFGDVRKQAAQGNKGAANMVDTEKHPTKSI